MEHTLQTTIKTVEKGQRGLEFLRVLDGFSETDYHVIEPNREVLPFTDEAFERYKGLLGEFFSGYSLVGESRDKQDGALQVLKQHRWRAPIVVETPDSKREIWALRPVSRDDWHWAIGTWLGYPQCCVFAHIEDCKDYLRSDKINYSIKRKKAILERNPDKRLGYLPCWHCLENPPSKERVTKNITGHRVCPTPFPEEAPTGISAIMAMMDYLEGNLKPWTVHDNY